MKREEVEEEEEFPPREFADAGAGGGGGPRKELLRVMELTCLISFTLKSNKMLDPNLPERLIWIKWIRKMRSVIRMMRVMGH